MAFSLAGKFLNFYLEWNENKTMHYYSKNAPCHTEKTNLNAYLHPLLLLIALIQHVVYQGLTIQFPYASIHPYSW